MNGENETALGFLAFWLDAGSTLWFGGGDAFDDTCRRWIGLWEEARDGGHTEWMATAAGSLARIILLDQIPRNVFRGSPDQFATDPLALAAAEAAIAQRFDHTQTMPVKNFFYLPFQHSEDLTVQMRGVDLYRRAGDKEAYHWALIHADAIQRFGRFPHRNRALGRETTAQEADYLASGGFGS
ncbi:DUF924 family protein [Acuticoccus mangrovi]|uniref:DUF924 family protein n=1 Tax=Acuticoccus mangrovi TaxID=2796142 RepID=A0A934MLZ7_9HYPH|nr:DUF924 family protein [Acuticoccus mangrovi]MBJ3776819.1 DUF924 family protein [Acuticoccus mangrovi]